MAETSAPQGQRGRGERLADGVQVDGPAEPMAQLDRPDQPVVAIGLGGVAAVADDDVVAGRWRLEDPVPGGPPCHPGAALV